MAPLHSCPGSLGCIEEEELLLPRPIWPFGRPKRQKTCGDRCCSFSATVIYHVLKNHTDYKDLGQDYFDKLNSKRLVPYLVNLLKNIGYEVNLTPLESAA